MATVHQTIVEEYLSRVDGGYLSGLGDLVWDAASGYDSRVARAIVRLHDEGDGRLSVRSRGGYVAHTEEPLPAEEAAALFGRVIDTIRGREYDECARPVGGTVNVS